MKRLTIATALFFISVFAFSQSPDRINYQAVARDLAGNPLINTAVNLNFEILQGSANGAVSYGETQLKTTNQFGLFTAAIGEGTVLSGTFPGIAWGSNTYFLRITVNGDVLPATQLLSVPYALYSKESGNGPAGTNGINCWDTNANGVDDPSEDVNNDSFFNALDCQGAEGDAGIAGSAGLNGLGIMWLGTFSGAPGGHNINEAYYNSIVGKSYIWDGNSWAQIAQDGTSPTFIVGNGITIVGSTISAVDESASNELQTLNIVGDSISISNGNTVVLPNTGIVLPTTGNTVGDVLKWNGIAWIAANDSVEDQDDSPSNEFQDLSHSRVGDTTNIKISDGASTSFSINDADADPNNERITTFALNGTKDSVIIVEAGIPHTFLLSKLNDGDWTKGTGNDIVNITDSVGVGTNDPKSLLQLGARTHLYPLNLAGNKLSVLSNNLYFDGTGPRSTVTGPAVINYFGEELSNPFYKIYLYNSTPANTAVLATDLANKFAFGSFGLAINNDNPTAALDISPKDSKGILLRTADNGQVPYLNFQDADGDQVGLRVPDVLLSSYNLIVPNDLPAVSGSALVADGSGVLSWQIPLVPSSLWSGSAGVVYPATLSDNLGIGINTPAYGLDLFRSSSNALFNIESNNAAQNTLAGIRFAMGNQAITGTQYYAYAQKIDNTVNGTQSDFVMRKDFSTAGGYLKFFRFDNTSADIIINDSKTAAGAFGDFIVKNGNVGIGTRSPMVNLHVVKDGGNSVILAQAFDGEPTFIFSRSNDSSIGPTPVLNGGCHRYIEFFRRDRKWIFWTIIDYWCSGYAKLGAFKNRKFNRICNN